MAMNIRPFIMNGRIVSNLALRSAHYLMTLELPPDFIAPLPGQFVMMRLQDRRDLLLARPFSISGYECDARGTRIEILYRISGLGTRMFSRLACGQNVNIAGPFGRAFHISDDIKNVILVAGGIGIAPLRYLMAFLKKRDAACGRRVDLFMGARTADEMPDLQVIQPQCDDLLVCTDDCSMGQAGFVTESLKKAMHAYPAGDSLICACGPVGMMRHLSEIMDGHSISCQVSLEERMACGIGACLGCAVAVRDQNGEKIYRRVCRDGPVFELKDILWE
jgi:dihydroorotate dehydrogenase electron transfer subunit